MGVSTVSEAGVLHVAPLFVPATRPDRFVKAARSGAEAVIIDLEDAVAPAEKSITRDALRREMLPDFPVILRINAAGTQWFEDDARAALRLGINCLMLPKAESVEDVQRLRQIAGDVGVIALIESARGLANARNIALAGIQRLAFGSIDYCVDIGCSHEPDAMLFARSEVVLASRLAGILPPLDGVTLSFEDQELVETDARRAASLGFGGKLCIHPTQISIVQKAFAPTDAEVTWAQAILAHDSLGAANVAGTMVDEPVRLRARQILGRISNRKEL